MEKRQDFPDAALTQEKARQQIRARHKAWRMELPQEEVQEKSRKICERLAASDWYHNSAVIYGYYPLGAEADCLPFLAQALSDGKTVALPVTSKERLQRDCGQNAGHTPDGVLPDQRAFQSAGGRLSCDGAG